MDSFAGAAMRGAGVFSASPAPAPEPDLQVRRLRRWRVFGAVFIACSLLGLIYDFSRPAEYRAQARVQITPAAGLPPAASSQQPAPVAPTPAQGLTDEVQRLTGRPLMRSSTCCRRRPSQTAGSSSWLRWGGIRIRWRDW